MALHNIYDDFDKLQTGYRIIELINRTTAENQENAEIFRLLCDSLEFLENATKNYINVLFNFEFKLLELLGFKINIDDLPANNIDKSVENGYFYETRFNAGDLKNVEAICRGNFNSIISLNINKSQVFALRDFLITTCGIILNMQEYQKQKEFLIQTKPAFAASHKKEHIFLYRR